MPIVGGWDIHRKQLTFDYLDTATGEARRGQVAPADRVHLRSWLVRFAGRDDVAFALEGCTGWRYVAGVLSWACPSRQGGCRVGRCSSCRAVRVMRVLWPIGTCGCRKPGPPAQMLCRSWSIRSRVRVPGGQILVGPEVG
jgi:hypothetical protein